MTDIRELTVKITLSPMQWGQQPGNLRFTLFLNSETLPVGAVTIGGSLGYKLQNKISEEGMLNAKVVCPEGRGNVFVLTHLEGKKGWKVWTEVLEEKEEIPPRVLVDNVELPVSRRNAGSRVVRQSVEA